jgi:hypothetical protein
MLWVLWTLSPGLPKLRSWKRCERLLPAFDTQMYSGACVASDFIWYATYHKVTKAIYGLFYSGTQVGPLANMPHGALLGITLSVITPNLT